jgi:uncharacterized membrane protein
MNFKRSTQIFLLLFSSWLVLRTSARLIVPQYNTSIPSAQYYFKGDEQDATFLPISAFLADSSQSVLRDKIVYLAKVGDSFFLSEVQRIQNAGGIAVLYGSTSAIPGRSGCALAGGTANSLVSIPVAEVFAHDFEEILAGILEGQLVGATLTSEGNDWTTTLRSVAVIVVFRVILSGTALGLIGYALYKLIMYIRVQGPAFNVPQVCLGLEIIANILRVVYLLVDPFGCFGYYGFAFPLLTTISFPFDVATFILITLYWYEAVTDASIKVYPFLKRSRVAFFVCAIGFLAAMLIVSILGLVLAFNITFPLIIIYTGISSIFVVFYVVIVAKITKKVQQNRNVRPKDSRNIKKLNIKIILNGVTRVLAMIPVLVFIALAVNDVPVPHVIDSAFIYAFIMLDSWARIYLFRVPHSKKSSSNANEIQENRSSDVAPVPTSTNEDIVASEAQG